MAALDNHDTNGRNQSHTVCGAERALSITLAGLRLQDSQCIHFHMDGLPWLTHQGADLRPFGCPTGCSSRLQHFRGHCSLFAPVWRRYTGTMLTGHCDSIGAACKGILPTYRISTSALDGRTTNSCDTSNVNSPLGVRSLKIPPLLA